MRLTLRTLLAYMDDLLEPAQANEIGRKISESGYASSLVNQIREVIRRRRLTAPTVHGPGSGLDPNSVAEYLDNTMSPDAVADVEKVCLDSDLHLAEVASCHQILTLVLGEPVDVPTATRERIYALGPAGESSGKGASSGHRLVIPDSVVEDSVADGTSARNATIDSDVARSSGGLDSEAAGTTTQRWSRVTLPPADSTESDNAGSNPSKKPADSSPRTDGSANGRSRDPKPGSNGHATRSTTEEDDFRHTIPDYLKPAPLWKRMAPLVVGVVVAGAWLATIYIDTTGTHQDAASAPAGSGADDGATSGLIAANDSSNADAPLPGNGPADNNEPDPDAGQPGDAVEVAAANSSAAMTRSPSDGSVPDINTLPGFDPEPPATSRPAQPEAVASVTGASANSAGPPAAALTSVAAASPSSQGKPGDATGTASSPITTSPADNTTPTPNGNPTVSPQTPVVQPQVVAPPETVYASREGIIARWTDEGWAVLPRRSALKPGDRIAVPEPFTAMLQINSLKLNIELQGGTVIEFLNGSPTAAFGLNVSRGRITLHRSDLNTEGRAIAMNLVIDDEPCRLELLTDEAVCGIEILPAEPVKLDTLPAPDRYSGGLYVITGDIQFHGDQSGTERVNSPGWLPLALSSRRLLASQPDRHPLLTTPEWLDTSERRQSVTQRRYAAMFEKEIDVDAPLRNSVPGAVMSSVQTISELAVKCLATTEQPEELVTSLARVEFYESREAAIIGLRQWLARDLQHGPELMQMLRKVFPPEQVEPVYEMLWGYDTDDARNPQRSQILVDRLDDDDSVVIRHLAFLNVLRLTGQRHEYNPANPANQRRLALDRWKAHLEKHGGALAQ